MKDLSIRTALPRVVIADAKILFLKQITTSEYSRLHAHILRARLHTDYCRICLQTQFPMVAMGVKGYKVEVVNFTPCNRPV